MKKVLSLVLAFAMILGSFGFVFASQFPDVDDTEYYSEPVNVLSGFGVIGGFPDGTFKPAEEVTRAQMATMIVNALGMTVTGQSDTKFSDVPKSHWASGFIAYATSVGFVAGYPDGTFKPDQQVTYDQALTMIVAALGYTSEALPGNWPGNFVNKARGLEILDTCKTTGSAAAPRQDIACFLYDALDCAIGYTDKDGTWHFNDADGDNKADDDMFTRLGAVGFDGGNGKGSPFIVTGEEDAVIDMDKYFGAYITAYASKDDDTKIVAIKEVLSEFVEGKVNAAGDKISGDTDYKISAVGTTPVQGGANGDFIFFTNGDDDTKAKPSYNSTTGKKLTFAVKLNAGKVSEIYSVQEWTAAATFRAGEDIQTELEDDQTLDSTYNFVLDDDDEIDESAFIMLGKSALADLAEDDIITVYLDSASKVAKLEVCDKPVEGVITKANKTNDAFTIGGTEYDLATAKTAGTAALCTSLAPDDEGTFFLTYAGEIFDFDKTSGTKAYAVVLDLGKDTGRYGSSDYFMKLFLADGSNAEFAVDADEVGTTFITKTGWTTAIKSGSIVEYEIDSDNVVIGLTDKSGTPAGKGSFDVNGITGTNVATSDTIIFSYSGDGTDYTKAGDYSVLALSDILDSDYSAISGTATSGNFDVILLEGVEESSKEFAIFATFDGTNADGKIWTVLYEGAVKEMTSKNSVSPAEFATSKAIELFTLTFDGEVIKKVTTESAIAAQSKTPVTATTKVEVSGNILKIAGTNYSLDPDHVVYIYDESDEKWTKGKLANTKYNFVYVVDTDAVPGDGIYDIVIVTKD